MPIKHIVRVALVTGCILLIPLIAMQFTDEVAWDLFDFVVAGTLLFGTGLAYTLVAHKGRAHAYRAGTSMALATTFLLIWINLAVGIIGSEDNPANMLYVAVFLVGLLGAALARLRAFGMARTLFAMALTQALVPFIALIIWQPPLTAGTLGVLALNTVFVALFIGSGLLFRRAHITQAKAS